MGSWMGNGETYNAGVILSVFRRKCTNRKKGFYGRLTLAEIGLAMRIFVNHLNKIV